MTIARNPYVRFAQQTTETPQSEPILGSSQEPNSAGGYSWAVDKWVHLERFLILGSEGGTYYITEQELTLKNAKNVLDCVKDDGSRVLNALLQVSTLGRAPKNDPALFVLAIAASHGNDQVRAQALNLLPQVARTGTHLMHFAAYVDGMRGWGRGLKSAVARWYNSKSIRDLEYQLVKYQSRDKWSNRDLLRLSHPKAESEVRNFLYKWVVDGAEEAGIYKDESDGADEMRLRGKYAIEEVASGCRLVFPFELLKTVTDPAQAATIIRNTGMPREGVPTALLNSPEVWRALLLGAEDGRNRMPITAMVRNLGNMTKAGVLAPWNAETNFVVNALHDEAAVRNSRIHPLAVYAALRVYSEGKGIKGGNSWEPVASIVQALEDTLSLSFKNVTPSNKRIVLGIDVSGSMTMAYVNGMPYMTAAEAAMVQAWILVNVEPLVQVVLFDTEYHIVQLNKNADSKTLREQARRFGGGGTDTSLPFKYALDNKLNADAIIMLTDSETWAGNVHAQQLFDKFRKQINPRAKAVVVSATANKSTIGDPDDAGILQVVGLDTSVPQVVADFLEH